MEKNERDDIEENYVPEPDEITEETDHDVEVADYQELNIGRVEVPDPEVETGQKSGFKDAVAQLTGSFGDTVLTGSPSTETEDKAIGREGIKDIAEAADEKLAKKLNNNEKDE